jgi:hypothetical protein
MEIGMFGSCDSEENLVSLGKELMPDKSVWAAVGLAWWDEKPNWTGDGNKVLCNGIGNLCKWGFCSFIGKTYRVSFNLIITSGVLRYIGNSMLVLHSGYNCIDYAGQGDGVNGYFYNVGFVGNVSDLSVREISGGGLSSNMVGNPVELP